MQPTYIVPAARAVIFDDQDRILLIRRGDNHLWALPAGTMEPGESVTDCMAREVWEETGLTVDLCKRIRHLLRTTLHRTHAS